MFSPFRSAQTSRSSLNFGVYLTIRYTEGLLHLNCYRVTAGGFLTKKFVAITLRNFFPVRQNLTHVAKAVARRFALRNVPCNIMLTAK